MKFEQMGLSEATMQSLNKIGFIEATPIQEQAIPQLLAGDIDMLGLAQTGTGKTAAFSLPILEKVDAQNRNPQAIILCPTRELCIQITSDIERFSEFHKGINTVAIYGGASIVNQIRELRRGVQIIVATPGRMLDVIDRGEVKFDNIRVAVLDEADEMLNMGFKESITEILSKTPDDKCTWLFTATMPRDIKNICKKFMKNPIEVQVAVNTGNENIEHEYYIVAPHQKYNALKRLVDYNPDIFGIVFCRTKNEAKEIADKLIRDGYNSDALHGDLTQQQRDIVMNRYREKSLQMLIATDVAARGIDVSDVTHVINYALPDDLESYTHRSGRTARAGKKGVSMSIITRRDLSKINEIERMIGKKIVKAEVPTGYQVCERQLFSIIEKAKNAEVNEEQLAPYIDQITTAFDGMSKEDVIKRFASLEFNRFLTYYTGSQDLNMPASTRGERSERNDRSERGERGSAPSAQPGFTRFFINIGMEDNLRRGDLLRMICDETGINGSSVGRIDMKGTFSFFEVENKVANSLKGIRGLQHNGRNLRVDLASGDAGNNRYNEGRNHNRREYSNGDRKIGNAGSGLRNNGSGQRREFVSRDNESTNRKSNEGNTKPKKRENRFPYELGDFSI